MAGETTRTWYDARMELSQPHEQGQHLLLRVKRTFSFDRFGRCRPGEAEALAGDPRQPGQGPALSPGCDFWPRRRATDVAVLACACSPGGRPTRRMEVSVRVGPARKRVAVFGRREVVWRHGRPRIGAAEPFVKMPLTREHA